MNYDDIGYDSKLNKIGGLGAVVSDYELAIDNDLTEEKNPFKQNTIITKQLYKSTLGGSVQFVDKTGGTVILSYDPKTGTITLNGGILVQQTLNLGTITNTVISGTSTVVNVLSGGTHNNGTFGSPAITGGTANMQVLGSPTITGGSINGPRMLGTPIFTVNSGTATLGVNGAFEIQTKSGSAVLVIRTGGTNFFFTSGGTF